MTGIKIGVGLGVVIGLMLAVELAMIYDSLTGIQSKQASPPNVQLVNIGECNYIATTQPFTITHRGDCTNHPTLKYFKQP